MRHGASLLLLAALAASSWAAPPTIEIPPEVKPTQGYVRVTPKTDAVSIVYVSLDGLYPFPSEELKDSRRFVLPVAGVKPGRYRFVAVGASKGGEQASVEFVAVIGDAPVPPDPKPPEPKPPGPVTSFRVIFIYESADNLTPNQRAVIYGKTVEDFLNANCTGGKAGWRRRDKDAPGESDPTFSALWTAIKPHIAATPCVAIERNGKVDIISIEATPAKMVETLQTYRGK